MAHGRLSQSQLQL